WGVINPPHVEADLAHQCQIGIDLFRSSEIISLYVRFERSVGNPFNKKFSGAFEKEFCNWPNPRVCCRYHVKRRLRLLRDQNIPGLRVRDSSTSLGMTNCKCCSR